MPNFPARESQLSEFQQMSIGASPLLGVGEPIDRRVSLPEEAMTIPSQALQRPPQEVRSSVDEELLQQRRLAEMGQTPQDSRQMMVIRRNPFEEGERARSIGGRPIANERQMTPSRPPFPEPDQSMRRSPRPSFPELDRGMKRPPRRIMGGNQMMLPSVDFQSLFARFAKGV